MRFRSGNTVVKFSKRQIYRNIEIKLHFLSNNGTLPVNRFCVVHFPEKPEKRFTKYKKKLSQNFGYRGHFPKSTEFGETGIYGSWPHYHNLKIRVHTKFHFSNF
jgi:hypothetical protein